ncbi:hypothetical protein QEN58_13680 [Halomonas alkaliantarctica]|uniref:Uncharacterized protein n=1 Tax=Halomonas alkaliantarctica TaxID=232346 RepID=A0ABY8LIW2_9GAMM|nr:hypothetical protein [Halomonas alkaliantarctica]WGI24374.1 hypothetical protein QEN58_13680 [Halomonas alkaliantarctica]
MKCRKPQERDELMTQLGDTHNRPTPTSFLMGQMWQEHLQQTPINTVIEVKSGLPGMGVELQDVAIIKRLEGRTHNTPAYSGWTKESETQITPLLTQLSASSIRYLVYTPAGKRAWGLRQASVTVGMCKCSFEKYRKSLFYPMIGSIPRLNR